MMYFTIIINLFASINLSRKFTFFSPINFFCLFNTTLIIVYFLVINENEFIDIYNSNFSFPINEIGINSEQTSYLYLFFSILCLIFSFLKKKDSLISTSRPIEKKIEVDQTLLNFISVILFLSTLIHALDLNWGIYWSYDYYLQVNQIDFNQLDFLISQIFSSAKRLIGIISIFCFFCVNKKSIFKILFLITFLYITFLTLIELSRFLPLLFLTIIISQYILKIKINFIQLAFLTFLSILSYIFVMETRGGTIFGINEFFNQIDYILSHETNIASRALGNLFQGAIIFDISLNVNTYYPQIHKFLSFFPTLTVIDGWNIEWTLGNMINRNTPISSFAEAYKFGILYLLFYQIIFVLMLYLSSFNFNSKKEDFNFLLLTKIISYYLIFFTSQYTLRPSMRMILINFLIMAFVIYFKKKEEN